MKIFSYSFYARHTTIVARELLGALLIRSHNGVLHGGIITETEAYTNDEPACHAFKGQTERNGALFGAVGHAYVYFIYGKHFCLNAVAHDKAQHAAGGVLIRALHPVIGIEHMLQKRGVKGLKKLISGPGTLAQALSIDRSHNGIDLTTGQELYIAQGVTVPDADVKITPRIGLSQAKDLLRRYVVAKIPDLPESL